MSEESLTKLEINLNKFFENEDIQIVNPKEKTYEYFERKKQIILSEKLTRKSSRLSELDLQMIENSGSPKHKKSLSSLRLGDNSPSFL